MITNSGKVFLKKYLAGQAGTVVGAIAIGIGDTAATVNDVALQLEFARSPVDVISYDFSSDTLIFKATLDETIGGQIREVGLWSIENSPAPGTQESELIVSFDSVTETWNSGTWDSSVTRVGPDSLKLTPALSTTAVSVMTGINLDFSANASQDIFTMAWNNDNVRASAIKFDFRTDASNYYEFSASSPTSTGYKIQQFTLGSATVVGTPDWANINEIAVQVTATSGGAASVEFDAIRIDNVDSVTPDYVLLDRFVPVTPVTKALGSVQDVEFSLAVSV